MSKRSRPPTLLTRAHRLVRDERLFGRDDLVLCACSGGPDSMALLHVLALLRKRIGHRLHVVGVDHGLRTEASAELAGAEQLAAQEGVSFTSVSAAVSPGSNLQARARRARHEALQVEAERYGAAVLALGHTADDRAETVLIRLLRGSGPSGLAVMPARAPAPFGGSASLVRPLLGSRRDDVMAHLRRHHLPYAEDPSNSDTRFLRVRVRHQVIPMLEQLSPPVVEHLCGLAEMLGASDGDLDGAPLKDFSRAQRQEIERAWRRGRDSITVRVSGGRDVKIIFLGKTPVLCAPE